MTRAYRFMPRPKNSDEFDRFIGMQEKIVAKAVKRFGPDGGPTANARFHLAVSLERAGRQDEARLMYEEVLAANRRHRDSEDPNVLGAEEHLAMNLFRSGKLGEARSLFAHVRDARERTLGSGDPATQRPSNWIAAIEVAEEQGRGTVA